MPYKNKEDKLKNSRRYSEENREEINKRQNDRYHNLTEEQRIERREKRKEWEKNNKEKINEKMRQRKSNHKQYLIDMLGGKCNGCGTTQNLQFDHIDRKSKSFCIGKSLGSKLEKLEEEAKKCQLLCKSCHEYKTTANHDTDMMAKGMKVESINTIGDKVIITLCKN